VVGRGVRAGVARTKLQGQQLEGVVAPDTERVEPERTLERRRRVLLLGVGEHDRGIHVEDDQVLLEGASGDPRRRWSAGQIPHPRSGSRPCLLDPSQPGRGELIQGAPHRRRRGHRTQHRVLVAQGVDVGDRLCATGEHGGHIDQDLSAVVPRDEPTTRQGAGEFGCQADPVRQQTHRDSAGVGDHADTITRDRQASSPRCTLHVPSAFPCRVFVTSQSQVFRYRTGTLVHPGGASPTHP
jgi:hypothetical protein